MVDPTSPRPRLVSVNGDRSDPPTEPVPPEAPKDGQPMVRRRLLWLVLALTLLTAIALVLQAEKVRSLTARNAELAGELFTARSALEAYAARFVEVRETVGGLQAQLEQLSVLVNEDPVTRESVAPAAGADPATPSD
jgi:hypothetical protein